MTPSKLSRHVLSNWSTNCVRKLLNNSGLYCAIVGKQAAKLFGEHLSSVDLTALSKILIRPAARGPGVSAIGGAGGGEGEWESRCVTEGMLSIKMGNKRKLRHRMLMIDALGVDVVAWLFTPERAKGSHGNWRFGPTTPRSINFR